MKVIAIGNYTWSSTRLEEAIEKSPSERVELKILDGDEIRVFPIEYREGNAHESHSPPGRRGSAGADPQSAE